MTTLYNVIILSFVPPPHFCPQSPPFTPHTAVHVQVVACFAETQTGQTDKIVLYDSKKVDYTPNFVELLQHINPAKGAEFATQLANDESGALVLGIERVSFYPSCDRVEAS
jgi:hypothetical protein